MDPQTNGHAPQQELGPQQPQAHPDAIRQALLNRIDMLRRQLSQSQDETDSINAMLITEQARSMSLQAQLDQLRTELEKQHQTADSTTVEPVPDGAASN
jgi:hypothetical protein